MKIAYKAKGLVYGRYWGGGEGSYRAERYHADDLKTLEEQINDGVKTGSIDSGMGYERVLGAIMEITTIRTIEKGGRSFVNEESELKFFGDLNEQQMEFLEENSYQIYE